MSASRTQTITTNSSSNAGPSRSRPAQPPTTNPMELEEDDLEEDEDEIIRRAQEKVCRMKERKAAAAAAAQQKAEEEAARKAVEEERAQAVAREERRKRLAEAATARSRRGSSLGEGSRSPRRPVVEIRKEKGKGKARAPPMDEDPDDGGDGDDDDDEDDRAPCERCRTKKLSCQMQAGKRSSIICKPCHDAKVKCSYSGRPSMVKREGGGQPTGERLAVLESQVAQLLADNRQLRDGQVKANTYHRHFNRKLDWLITDAARRRRTPPELPEAGPSGVSKKRRRVVDSDEEEEQEIEGEMEKEGEEVEVEVEGGEEGDEPAPKKARSEKGKEREE
ncbi:hypothetical protein F5876DRAFT_84775 [Lentinula aff. lateritia]|uniref:Uncharacterized protein n=1 Tax=Lentinula aff. lateritia TaxID=2804960 RepID=A0ACC1TG20_9AGAR|nr:hypothetical protein F5876DRAFT_84775 [Lentinula aff. lateritia]